MANWKKKRSRGEPEPRSADEFSERGAGVRACGFGPSPVEREKVAEGRMRVEFRIVC